MFFGSPCLPCCSKIGFDLTNALTGSPEGVGTILTCYHGFSAVNNISQDVTKLLGLKLVFAGYNTSTLCDTAISVRFQAADFGAVQHWIESGGRLVMFSEFSGCIVDPVQLNAFLSAIGATMRWVARADDVGCHDLDAGRDRRCTAGVANIAQGLTDAVYMAAAAEVSGGTSIFFSPSGRVIFAVEQLGDGFLFLCSDSSMRPGNCDGLHASNCEFFRRLYDYADSEII